MSVHIKCTPRMAELKKLSKRNQQQQQRRGGGGVGGGGKGRDRQTDRQTDTERGRETGGGESNKTFYEICSHRMRHSRSFCHQLGVEVCHKIQSGVTGGGRAQLEHKLKSDQACQAEVSSPDPLCLACTQHWSSVCDQGVRNGSSAVVHSPAGMIGLICLDFF